MEKEDVCETLADMSIGATVAVGLVTYIEQHATFFTVLIGFCGLLVAVIFHSIRVWLAHRQLKLQEKEGQNTTPLNKNAGS